jgi:uncharacterized damage-inducible protein DinB
MTVIQPDPPLAPDELVSAAGERAVLETFLDLYRGILKRKVTGISEEQARQRLVASKTTLAGLVKHLTAVEREWFQAILAQRSPDETGGIPDDDGWTVAADETVADLLKGYAHACEQSRRCAAGVALDDSVPHPRLGQVSLRWIYVHMIEETARHTGHADILREQVDGTTGFDG